MKDESSGQAASALSLSKGAGASKIRPCFDRLSMPEGRSVWLSDKRPELVEGCDGLLKIFFAQRKQSFSRRAVRES